MKREIERMRWRKVERKRDQTLHTWIPLNFEASNDECIDNPLKFAIDFGVKRERETMKLVCAARNCLFSCQCSFI